MSTTAILEQVKTSLAENAAANAEALAGLVKTIVDKGQAPSPKTIKAVLQENDLDTDTLALLCKRRELFKYAKEQAAITETLQPQAQATAADIRAEVERFRPLLEEHEARMRELHGTAQGIHDRIEQANRAGQGARSAAINILTPAQREKRQTLAFNREKLEGTGLAFIPKIVSECGNLATAQKTVKEIEARLPRSQQLGGWQGNPSRDQAELEAARADVTKREKVIADLRRQKAEVGRQCAALNGQISLLDNFLAD
jgi:hypothetical protein